jgi:hypothetical protein
VLPQPGEGTGPGNLHAYLHGVGVEIMGASDNVVRGGLTRKHVDVDELLEVLRFDALPNPVVRPVEELPGRWRYPTPNQPFELWRFEVVGSMPHTARGRELLLCTSGDAGLPMRAYLARLDWRPEHRSFRAPARCFWTDAQRRSATGRSAGRLSRGGPIPALPSCRRTAAG